MLCKTTDCASDHCTNCGDHSSERLCSGCVEQRAYDAMAQAHDENDPEDEEARAALWARFEI